MRQPMIYAHNGVGIANSPDQIEFDLGEIPKYQIESICLAVSALIKRVKEDPALYAEFLAWKANRGERMGKNL